MPKMGAKKAANLFKTYCLWCRFDRRRLFSSHGERRAGFLPVAILIADLQGLPGLSTAGGTRSS